MFIKRCCFFPLFVLVSVFSRSQTILYNPWRRVEKLKSLKLSACGWGLLILSIPRPCGGQGTSQYHYLQLFPLTLERALEKTFNLLPRETKAWLPVLPPTSKEKAESQNVTINNTYSFNSPIFNTLCMTTSNPETICVTFSSLLLRMGKRQVSSSIKWRKKS